MDGLGGRGATWCHKARLERACPESVQPASASSQSGPAAFGPEAEAAGPGHRPCSEARQD